MPEKVYRGLQYASESAGKSIQELAAQSVRESFPPLLDVIPVRFRDDLSKLKKLSDDELWVVARSKVEEKSQTRLRRLLNKNKRGQLTDREREVLMESLDHADLVMLRKAYAFLLLKWRGHRIPTLAELESEA